MFTLQVIFTKHVIFFQLTTDILIDQYHAERLNECQQLIEDGNCFNANQYYGILTARIYFSNDCLFIEILSARDVVPLDNNGKHCIILVTEIIKIINECFYIDKICLKNVIHISGLSDPFVVVELLPKRIFYDYPPQQTEVLKRSLNPSFDESFEL